MASVERPQSPEQQQSQLQAIFKRTALGQEVTPELIQTCCGEIAQLLQPVGITHSLKQFIVRRYEKYAEELLSGARKLQSFNLPDDLHFLKGGKGVFSESMHERIQHEKRAYRQDFSQEVHHDQPAEVQEPVRLRRFTSDEIQRRNTWLHEFSSLYGLPTLDI